MTALVLRDNTWNPYIDQIEIGEEISGGEFGVANQATRQLAENVFYLKAENVLLKQQIHDLTTRLDNL